MIPFLLVAVFSLALFHWAFENAIAPSLRLGLRYRLFRLRDDLRAFAEGNANTLKSPAVRLLEECVNNAIRNLRQIDLVLLITFSRRFQSDGHFRSVL